MRSISYTKRPRAEYLQLRKEFENTHRPAFAKHLVADEARVAQMRAAGLTDADRALLKKGNIPPAYEVHHKIPLDTPDRVLDLLSVGAENAHSAVLRFAADRAIRLEIGRLACHLGDVGEPWPTPWKPAHPVE